MPIKIEIIKILKTNIMLIIIKREIIIFPEIEIVKKLRYRKMSVGRTPDT